MYKGSNRVSRNIIQVKIHKASVRVVVFGIHTDKTVLFIERNSIQVGIYRQEPTAGICLSRHHRNQND